MKRLLEAEWVGLAGAILVGAIALSIISPAFLSEFNFYVLLRSACVSLLVAFAQMVTLGVGQMNLSVGGMGGMVAVLFGGMMEAYGVPLWLALPAAIAIGALSGLINGLLNALLLANVMAEEGKTLGQLVADLQAEYGEHQYGRIDLHIPDDLKNAAIARARAQKPGDASVAGMPILHIETLDGVKFYLDNPEAKTKPNAAETWILFRASGTEPLMRVYTESTSKEAVAKLLEAGRTFALGK